MPRCRSVSLKAVCTFLKLRMCAEVIRLACTTRNTRAGGVPTTAGTYRVPGLPGKPGSEGMRYVLLCQITGKRARIQGKLQGAPRMPWRRSVSSKAVCCRFICEMAAVELSEKTGQTPEATGGDYTYEWKDLAAETKVGHKKTAVNTDYYIKSSAA